MISEKQSIFIKIDYNYHKNTNKNRVVQSLLFRYSSTIIRTIRGIFL